ncbi:hypothetical protein AB6A40_010223 [Gnathostoma spinigerum]|uniref:Uncharacterized protein n=1 Tax=Gnathostoma spinigerum TaxID=75299 RepID=A0ABD6EZA1_9BILA
MSPRHPAFRCSNSGSRWSPTHSAAVDINQECASVRSNQMTPLFYLASPQRLGHSLPSTNQNSNIAKKGSITSRLRSFTNRPKSAVICHWSESNNDIRCEEPQPLLSISMNAASSLSTPSMMNRTQDKSRKASSSFTPPQRSKKAARNGKYEVGRSNEYRNQKLHPNRCYAGSKFIESPEAQAIPLPPAQWFQENGASSKVKQDELAEADTSMSSFPDSPRSSMIPCRNALQQSPIPNRRAMQAYRAIRMNPHQLIAAVAAS